MSVRVLTPGMLTSVQDLGRSGLAHLGVARGGAADTLSLRIGNRLVGNEDGAPALEFTLTGGEFEFDRETAIVVTGGACEVLIAGDRATPTWAASPVRAGERVRIGPVKKGCRAYLCVAGGFQVERVLGSGSTHLSAAFGGHAGRALRAGDTLGVGKSQGVISGIDGRPLGSDLLSRRRLRAIEAPTNAAFAKDAIDLFWSGEYVVSNHSDRAGVRLEGPGIQTLSGGRMPSEGMTQGVIEVPENGQPIVLGVDYPTTGGYPVIGCIAGVDLPVLGQLRPREAVRFERISVEEARALFRTHEVELDRLLPRVG